MKTWDDVVALSKELEKTIDEVTKTLRGDGTSRPLYDDETLALKRIEERASAAATISKMASGYCGGQVFRLSCQITDRGGMSEEDASFLAGAKEDILRVCDLCQKLLGQNASLKEKLEAGPSWLGDVAVALGTTRPDGKPLAMNWNQALHGIRDERRDRIQNEAVVSALKAGGQGAPTPEVEDFLDKATQALGMPVESLDTLLPYLEASRTVLDAVSSKDQQRDSNEDVKAAAGPMNAELVGEILRLASDQLEYLKKQR